MTHMKLKNKRFYLIKPNLRIKLIIFTFITLIFLFGLNALTTNVGYYFMNYAESEVVRLASIAINNSVTTESLNKLDFDTLYYITKNDNNEIEMVDYNSVVVNDFLNDVSSQIQKDLKELEKEKLFTIPFGSIINNPLFNSMGPNIPVKLKLISSVLTNINIKITEYGINNCLIEMVILIDLKSKIILPMISKDILIDNEVPISYKLISGKIPEYYGTGINKNSSIYAVPLEESK